MKVEIEHVFKMAFIMGLFLLFISFFLEWYVFQVFDSEQRLISSWHYNFIIGWYTNLPQESFNKLVKPEKNEISIGIHALSFLILFIAAYGCVFKELKSANSVVKIKNMRLLTYFYWS